MAELTAEQALKKARTLLKAAGQPGSKVEDVSSQLLELNHEVISLYLSVEL
jgi:hypothetical protein